MRKIMFVCHGNICRSPMAEYICKYMLNERGVAEKYSAFSAATSTEEIWGGVGNPIYPPAKAELLKHKIPFEERYATLVRRQDYGQYDLFVAMDDRNVRGLLRIFGGDPDGKIRKLMDYTEHPGDVSDPWYSRRFDVTFRDIWKGCSALIDALEAER